MGGLSSFRFSSSVPLLPRYCCALHLMRERKVYAVRMYIHFLPKLAFKVFGSTCDIETEKTQFIFNNILGFCANTGFYSCSYSGHAVTLHVEEANFLETFWQPKARTSMVLYGLGCSGGFPLLFSGLHSSQNVTQCICMSDIPTGPI